MNNTPDVKLTLQGDITSLRTGSLPDLVQRTVYAFKGSIRAPFGYYKGKQSLPAADVYFNKLNMVVEVDRTNITITFRENNLETCGSATVTGSATLSPELSALGINAGKKYSGLQLSDALRMNRLLFDSSDECVKIVTALKAFKAKIESEIEHADDKKGNKSAHFDQRITQPHDLRFTLNWPVLTGEGKVKFLVEINYDVRDKMIEFWLDSVEMHESIQDACQKIMDEQVAAFVAESITVVEK